MSELRTRSRWLCFVFVDKGGMVVLGGFSNHAIDSKMCKLSGTYHFLPGDDFSTVGFLRPASFFLPILIFELPW